MEDSIQKKQSQIEEFQKNVYPVGEINTEIFYSNSLKILEASMRYLRLSTSSFSK